MPRIRDRKILVEKIEALDALEMHLWAVGEWKNKSIEKEKADLYIAYLSAPYADKVHQKIVDNIKNDKDCKELFQMLIDMGTGDVLIGKADSPQSALHLAFVNKDKNAIASLKTMILDLNDIRKYDQNNNGMGLETLAHKKELKRKEIATKNLNSLKEKIYDESFVDPMTIDWGNPDVTTAEYRAAAGILVDKQIDIWDYNYSYSKCLKAKKEIDKQINSLANDIDFQGYVNEVLGKNNKELFEKNAFERGWKSYKKLLAEARNPENQERKKFFVESEAEGNVAGKETRESAKNKAELIGKQIIKERKIFSQIDYIKACDLVIANVIVGPNFDKTILKGNTEQDAVSKKFLNERVDEMRDKLIEDPVFQMVLSKRVDRVSFYSVYKSEVRKEINAKIAAERKFEKSFVGYSNKKNQHEKYVKENNVALDDKTKQFFKNTYKDFEDMNKGKKPSDYMERFIKALKVVVENEPVSIASMEELNKAALSYYKNRQGIIFSPITDAGKARLNGVENLIRVTDKMIRQERVKERKALAPKKAPVSKM